MPRNRRLLATALMLMAGLAQAAHAQSPHTFSAEVRAGAALPMGEFADSARTGWIGDVTLRYQASSAVGVYAGFDFASFPPAEDAPGVGRAIRDVGVRSGIRAALPLSGAAVTPWVEAGLLFNRATLWAHSGVSTGTRNAGWALGGEAGAGINMSLGRQAAFTPGVRFRSHNANFGSESGSITVSYLAVELGLMFRR
jgi:hypothetical protein